MLLDSVDRRVGMAVERAVCARHRRRLRRLGWEESLDPGAGGGTWCAADPPPRDGCRIEPLIDGASALPAIAEAIAGARSYVLVAGWHLTPEFVPSRDGDGTSIRELLAEAAERVPVRVLLWAGAPIGVFKPTRRQVAAVRERLVAGNRIACALDRRERPMHCHHEKLVVVDDEVAFVGGIDLTSMAGDRFDTTRHPARPDRGWHDASARLRGPIVGDVAGHLRQRWSEVAGERLEAGAPPPAAGEHRVQLLRTVPERRYRAWPQGRFTILEAYLRAVRSARTLVYLESQYLWSPELMIELIAKLERPPADEFRVVLVLPADPDNGDDATLGVLGALVEADRRGGGGRLLACTIVAPRAGEPPAEVYVHAKIGIVDDRWLTLGSANLNDRSLFNDTEVNVQTDAGDVARDTRLRLWAEHLERDPGELAGRPAHEVVDELWRPLAADGLGRRRRGEPARHRLAELPGVSRRSRRLLGPLDSLLVDG